MIDIIENCELRCMSSSSFLIGS